VQNQFTNTAEPIMEPAQAKPIQLLPGCVMAMGALALAWHRASEDHGASVLMAHGIAVIATLLFVVMVLSYGAKAMEHCEVTGPLAMVWWLAALPLAVLANAAQMYAGEISGPRLRLTAALLLLLATVSIAGLCVRTLYAFFTGRLPPD